MKLPQKTIGVMVAIQGVSLSVYAEPDFSISIHGNVAGGANGDAIERAATHNHDPDDDFTLQGIEVGVSLRANEYLEGFVAGNFFLTGEDEFEGETEEVFLKLINLPLGTEIRGGRYLNRIGTENNVHLHGWEFVNSNLTTGLLLGEEGLRTDGIELSWIKEYGAGEVHLSGSYGKPVSHGHEEEEEEEGEEHGHGEESLENGFFSDDLVTFRAQVTYGNNDFFQHKAGLSGAFGENGYGRDSSIVSADYLFTWREKGLEAGGKSISAGVEYYYRDTEWVDEDDATEVGSTSQNALALKTSYSWNDNWRIGLRYEWVDGADDSDAFELDKRERASVAVTYRRQIAEDWSTHARVQYNHDKIDSDRSNNAILQLGFSFGGGEVR